MIRTNEIDGLFNNEDLSLDEDQKKMLENLKSSHNDLSMHSKKEEMNMTNKAKQYEKPNIKPISTEDDFIIRKSENPNRKRSKNEERLLEIIKIKSKGMDDIDKLEQQMLAEEMENEESEFLKPLPQLGDHSVERVKRHQKWDDVDSDELMNAQDSFIKDNDLSNDSRIPSNLPPFDPDVGFVNLSNAYYSNHQGLSKNGNPHSISQNIISKTYASIDKHKKMRESITKKSIKVKKDRLNYTMPKKFILSNKETK